MLVTQAEYARRRCVSRQAVGNAIKRGILTLTPEGLVDVEQAEASWPLLFNARGATAPATRRHGLIAGRETWPGW